MKLQASLGDRPATVELRREGNRVFADVDGRRYELDIRESSERLLLINQGRVFQCRIDGAADSGKPFEVWVGTSSYAITLADPKRLRGAANDAGHGDGAARITAPMPGKVVRILVQTGDVVEPGSGIVVVEAMKMQNEMKSPKAGTVTSIAVSVGSTVNGGDVLAVIE